MTDWKCSTALKRHFVNRKLLPDVDFVKQDCNEDKNSDYYLKISLHMLSQAMSVSVDKSNESIRQFGKNLSRSESSDREITTHADIILSRMFH